MKWLIIIGMFLFTGCAVNKDNKALARVITRPELADRAYAELVKLHPVRIDSVVTYIEGKPIVTYDTVLMPLNITDTLLVSEVKYITKYVDRVITKIVKTTDTLRVSVPDSRQLDAAKTAITVLETQLRISQESDQKHVKGKKNWIFVCVGLGLLILLILALVFKKKI